jgi:hypothetical protein
MVEYQHRNEGGGNLVCLENGTWEHGELVLVLSKRELGDFLRLVGVEAGLDGRPNHAALNKRLMDLLAQIAAL